MTMHPDTNRLATGLAITRAPRYRHRRWMRRLELAAKLAVVLVTAVGYATAMLLILMIFFAGG